MSLSKLTENQTLKCEIPITGSEQSFLDKMSLSKLTANQTLKYESPITESELLNPLTSLDNDKLPGHDGITKEFYIKILGSY